MSQLGGPNSQRIGGVHIDVTAQGAQKAAADINATAAATRNLGTAAQTAAPKIDAAVGDGRRGISGFATALKSTTKPLRDFMSAIVGTLGLVTRALGVIGLVVSAIGAVTVGLVKLTEWIVKQGKGLKDLDERWQKVIDSNNEYMAVSEKLAKSQGGPLTTNINRASVKAAEEEHKKASEELASAQAKLSFFQSPAAGVLGTQARDTAVQYYAVQIARQESIIKKTAKFLAGVGARADTDTIFSQEAFRRKVDREAGGSADYYPDRISGSVEQILYQLQQMNSNRGGRDQ